MGSTILGFLLLEKAFQESKGKGSKGKSYNFDYDEKPTYEDELFRTIYEVVSAMQESYAKSGKEQVIAINDKFKTRKVFGRKKEEQVAEVYIAGRNLLEEYKQFPVTGCVEIIGLINGGEYFFIFRPEYEMMEIMKNIEISRDKKILHKNNYGEIKIITSYQSGEEDLEFKQFQEKLKQNLEEYKANQNMPTNQ